MPKEPCIKVALTPHFLAKGAKPHTSLCHLTSHVPTRSGVSRFTHHKDDLSSLARMSDSSTIAYPQNNSHAKTDACQRQKRNSHGEKANSRSSKLITVMSRIKQGGKRSKGDVIDKGEVLSDNEMVSCRSSK
jgi:hypothetical protein